MAFKPVVDVKLLLKALEESFSPDAHLRRQSEDYLLWFAKQNGSIPLLMQTAMHPQCDGNLRLAAAIRLKNQIVSQWDFTEGEQQISNEDKKHFIDNFYSVIVAVGPEGNAIRKQYFEVLRHVVLNIEITTLSSILSAVTADLKQRSSTDRLKCALLVLRRLANRYEYHSESAQTEVDQIIEAFFDDFLKVAQQSSQVGLSNPEAAGLIHLILKIYFSIALLTTPSTRVLKSTLGHWVQLIQFVLQYFISNKLSKPEIGSFTELTSSDEEDIGQYPQYKCLKWSLRIINRLVSRQSARLAGDELKRGFYKNFVTDGHCLDVCKGIFLLLEHENNGHLTLTNLIHHSIWILFRHLLQFPTIYDAILKPNTQAIVGVYLLKTFAYSSQDEVNYNADPEFYIQSCADISFQLYSNRGAAADFLHEACKSRTYDYIGAISTVIAQHFKAGVTDQEIFATLSIIGHAGSRVLIKSTGSQETGHGIVNVEQLLINNICPLLTGGGNMWLVMKAAWLTGCLVRKGNLQNSQLILELYTKLLDLLMDKELIVCVLSAGAIVEFFKLDNPVLTNAIVDSLPRLLERLFVLMERIELETVISALELIVERYSQRVMPFATEIVAKVCGSLSQAVASDMACAEAPNEDQVLARWTMLQTLTLITRLVATSSSDTQLRMNKDAIVMHSLQLFNCMFSQGANEDLLLDYIDELGILLANVIKICMVHCKASPQHAAMVAEVWNAYGRMITLIGSPGGSNGYSIIGEIATLQRVSRAIVSLNPQGFTSNYAQALMTMCERAAASGFSEEGDELLSNLLDVSLISRCCIGLVPRIVNHVLSRIKCVVDEIDYHYQYFRLVSMLVIYTCANNQGNLNQQVNFNQQLNLGELGYILKLGAFIHDMVPKVPYKSLRRLAIIAMCSLVKANVHVIEHRSLVGLVMSLLATEVHHQNTSPAATQAQGIKNWDPQEVDGGARGEGSDGSSSSYEDVDDDDSEYEDDDDSDYDEDDSDDFFDECDDYSPLANECAIQYAQCRLGACSSNFQGAG
ncbi:bifunctional Importin-beta [Babesia duncani]|uniref:Bifunctional Importin-beta n=1 Tax=Babesia duncani TaxID=323732 RepID=A0AAD9UPH8_9APIC|nr:bifunctional Importin-beta [Babesia duncani]